jgi:hypothetical protein
MQVDLLRSIEFVSDLVKARSLSSLVLTLFDHSNVPSSHRGSMELETLLASCFDTSVAQELNSNPGVWKAFVSLVRASVTGK